ncbi:Rv2175c family DNA-binding protein [Lolliginicoccus suaedae]|uniref:Rv2175c family DNA-binding protein n=1 Tax=Lolliginicoccus suaedae TaxID=2605429 RepID=UPI0011EC33CC|nr:Rv2175c family DNA-binding protein [Lolliginicoccus suaedae]
MSTFPVCEDVLAESDEVLPLPDVAEALGIPVTRVHQLLREDQMLAVRRDGIAMVPAVFLGPDEERPGRNRILKQLPGLIAVLRDGGFDHDGALAWMYEEDPSLPGRPVDALRTHSAREVMRRAQALAL